MLPFKSVLPNFVASLVFLGMAFSFIKLISSSGTSSKREAAAIITSAEVIIAEYDAILSQWERANFYNHLSNYTNNNNIIIIIDIKCKEKKSETQTGFEPTTLRDLVGCCCFFNILTLKVGWLATGYATM